MGLILPFGGVELCRLFMWTLITLMAEGEWTESGYCSMGEHRSMYQTFLAQQKDRKHSQMEGDEAAERML